MAVPTSDRGCDRWWPLINEAVEGTLDGPDREELERHLAVCPRCARAADDVAQIRRMAQALPPRTPRADAWERIAAGLARELPQPRAARPAALPTAWVTLAAAAVLVLAVAATVWLVRPSGGGTAPQRAAVPASAQPAATPVHPSPEELVKSVDEELRAAEQHYEKAITGLEQITKSGQDVLDPKLAATLQTNLGVIDKAIKDSRDAIQQQPGSQLAQESLFEALRRKVVLLEDTVALINAMRKGDQAGTAKVIQGMSKS